MKVVNRNICVFSFWWIPFFALFLSAGIALGEEVNELDADLLSDPTFNSNLTLETNKYLEGKKTEDLDTREVKKAEDAVEPSAAEGTARKVAEEKDPMPEGITDAARKSNDNEKKDAISPPMEAGNQTALGIAPGSSEKEPSKNESQDDLGFVFDPTASTVTDSPYLSQGAADKAPVSQANARTNVESKELQVGAVEIIKSEQAVGRVEIGDPDIVTLERQPGHKSLVLRTNQAGNTDVLLYDFDGKILKHYSFVIKGAKIEPLVLEKLSSYLEGVKDINIREGQGGVLLIERR